MFYFRIEKKSGASSFVNGYFLQYSDKVVPVFKLGGGQLSPWHKLGLYLQAYEFVPEL